MASYYCYTISVTEECLKDVVDDLVERINSGFKKVRPFRVVVEQEKMSADDTDEMVCRFRLVVVPDFVVKNERQAWKFCEVLKGAAEEVDAMNGQNYVLLRPPSRYGKGGRHA